MSLFGSPQEHEANPPSSWTVYKSISGRWVLWAGLGVLSTFRTKQQAQAAKTTGFYVDLYAKEKRWYAGESVHGWKPYELEPKQTVATAGP